MSFAECAADIVANLLDVGLKYELLEMYVEGKEGQEGDLVLTRPHRMYILCVPAKLTI